MALYFVMGEIVDEIRQNKNDILYSTSPISDDQLHQFQMFEKYYNRLSFCTLDNVWADFMHNRIFLTFDFGSYSNPTTQIS